MSFFAACHVGYWSQQTQADWLQNLLFGLKADLSEQPRDVGSWRGSDLGMSGVERDSTTSI
jgi:hypothetical protein